MKSIKNKQLALSGFRRVKAWIVWIPLLIFSACGHFDDPGRQEIQKIRFELIFPGATTTPLSGVPHTRVTTDDSYNSSWSDGDEVGIYIVKDNIGLQASGNWVDNMKMTYNNGSWNYILPAGKEYYPVGSTLTFYAYYPYMEGLATPLDLSFAVQADQSDIAAFEKSYLLTADETNAGNSTYPVRLNFSHRLAMIELEVSDGTTHGARMNNTVNTTLEGCKTTVSLNLSTGVITPVGDAALITMYRNEQPEDENYYNSFTYRAMVPAQSVEMNTELFRFSQGQRSLKHRLTTGITLHSGEVKPYRITLSAPDNNAESYALGDLYPHHGLAMGVVCRLEQGTQNGYLLSLEEIPSCQWSTEAVYVSATHNDGLMNMSEVQFRDATFSKYPAFAAVHQRNPQGTVYAAGMTGIWYLPSSLELAYIFDYNEIILSSGGVEVKGYYWSSSEYPNGKYAYGRGSIWHGTLLKGSSASIRPFMKF